MVKTVTDAVAMVEAICHLPDNQTAIRRQQAQIRSSGLKEAIAGHESCSKPSSVEFLV